MSHTKEPWIFDQQQYSASILTKDGGNLLLTGISIPMSAGDRQEEAKANARRIVACVNACAGVSTETLEKFGGRAITAESERDAYRDLCVDLLSSMYVVKSSFNNAPYQPKLEDLMNNINSAITKAEKLLGTEQ